MPNSSLVHGAWALAAISCFVLGSQVFPAAQEEGKESEAAGIDRGRSRSQATGGGSEGAPATGSGRAGNGQAAPGVSATLHSGRVVLTEDTIAALGDRFRSARSPIERRLAFSELLEGLTAENALLVREQIKHMPEHSPEFREFHYAWGALGGEMAVLNGKDTKKRDMAATFAGWASADPAAAQTWFANLPEDGRDRHTLKWGAVYGLADADPNVAMQFVANLRDGGDKEGERMMHVVTSAVLRGGDPAEAALWVDGLADGDLRIFARDRVAGEFVGRDPEAAGEWAAQYNNQPDGSRLINHVSRDWANRDPEAAVDWLESLDSSAGRIEGYGSAFGAWAGRNPEEAGAYLHDMPRSPERDSALSGYASRIMHEDPGTAISWANAIADPARREETLIRTGQHYHRRNPQEAADWLATSGLATEIQERIRHPKRR